MLEFFFKYIKNDFLVRIIQVIYVGTYEIIMVSRRMKKGEKRDERKIIFEKLLNCKTVVVCKTIQCHIYL